MEFLLIYGTEMSHPFIHRQKFELVSPLFPPLGLLYIGRSLEDEGHHVELLDLFVEKDSISEIKKKMTAVDAVGISVDNDSYNESAQLAHTIKNIDPSIPIIIGGPHCTLYPHDSLLNISAADISVCGDGEQAIKDVAAGLSGGKSFAEIPGIYYREKHDIKPGLPPTFIEDLDSLPFPARHLADKYDYGKCGETYLYRPKLTSMVTTRGCPFRCRYCLRHVLSNERFQQRSAQNVLDELSEINGTYGSVMIGDDTFLADKKRAHKIMDGLIELGSTVDVLIGGARVDSADRDLYKKMKKAGVKAINFGIESGNQDVLDFYNKRISLDQIRKAVRLSNEMNFFSTGTFILGAPLETKRHIEQTIKFARSLPLDNVGFYPLSYRHGSDLWREAVKNGLINENEHEVIADSRRGLANFTQEEMLQFCNKALRRFYVRPTYMTKEFFKAFIANDFRQVKSLIETVLHPTHFHLHNTLARNKNPP
jgi:radical SAM superfamily enzyme YgiQ (UPF0313 family)